MSQLDKQHARYMETGSEIFVQAIRIDLRKEWVGLFKLDLFSTVIFHRPARTCTCLKSYLLSHFQVCLFPLRKASDEQQAERTDAASVRKGIS